MKCPACGSEDGDTESTAGDAPAAEPDAVRRKRLRYRSWHRGMKEMDLILGRFADRALATMTAEHPRLLASASSSTGSSG